MLSSQAIQTYGHAIRALRAFTQGFDEQGTGVAQARSHKTHERKHRKQPLQKKLVEMSWDPITRIVGSLGIHTKIDFENRRVAECHTTSSIFRGYSVFMRGKDPRDAHFITSRICGICGDNHATCGVYAQNMAFGVKPPHLAEWIINLAEAAEYMFDHNLFQDNLVGVDFCEHDGPGNQSRRAGQGGANGGAARRRRTVTGPSPTSCARSIRSPARFISKRCR